MHSLAPSRRGLPGEFAGSQPGYFRFTVGSQTSDVNPHKLPFRDDSIILLRFWRAKKRPVAQPSGSRGRLCDSGGTSGGTFPATTGLGFT
jgi:hypothetical protein